MIKPIHLYFLLFCLATPITPVLCKKPVIIKTTNSIEEEYEKYKKEGDELFKKGDYNKALKKYQVCLEVPGFSNDTYANSKIEQCDQALLLRQKAEKALLQKNEPEAVTSFKQILVMNPNDEITKKSLADYWESEANERYQNQLFAEAKTRYQEALKYTEKTQNITISIQNCDEKLAAIKLKEELKKELEKEVIPEKVIEKVIEPAKEPVKEIVPEKVTEPVKEPIKEILPEKVIEPIKEPKKVLIEEKPEPTSIKKPAIITKTRRAIAPKVIVGLGAIASGALAMNLNKQWAEKLATLNTLASKADPSNTGLIFNYNDYITYNNGYKITSDFKNAMEKKRDAYVGAAAGLAVLETILLVMPKKKRTLSLLPTTDSYGMVLKMKF